MFESGRLYIAYTLFVKRSNNKGKGISERYNYPQSRSRCTINSIESSSELIEESMKFLKWLEELLINSLYGHAPYSKKIMALELLCTLVEYFQPHLTGQVHSIGFLIFKIQ